MRAAVDSEDAHSRNPLPANRLYPMHELLAEMLARFNEPARAAQLIGDQQQKTGAAGAVPAARIASRIALLSAVRQRAAAALQTLLARW